MHHTPSPASTRRGFNPRPAVRPGDAPTMAKPRAAAIGFNPRPAVRPGDACRRSQARQGIRRFNPRPAVRPGDAIRALTQFISRSTVSIRARP